MGVLSALKRKLDLNGEKKPEFKKSLAIKI
jgi:hypothetical protein